MIQKRMVLDQELLELKINSFLFSVCGSKSDDSTTPTCEFQVRRIVLSTYEVRDHCSALSSQEILDRPFCPDIPLNVYELHRHPEKSNAAPSNKQTASTIASKDYQ